MSPIIIRPIIGAMRHWLLWWGWRWTMLHLRMRRRNNNHRTRRRWWGYVRAFMMNNGWLIHNDNLTVRVILWYGITYFITNGWSMTKWHIVFSVQHNKCW